MNSESPIRKKKILTMAVNAMAGVMAASCLSYASAQEALQLEEVVVTATKRAESLQDIAVTVNAFGEQTIQDAGINDANDVAVMTPSLTASSSISPFNSRLSIRGIGTSQTDPALEPSVGLFVDGVYYGRTGLGMSDLTDIQRIEVLQGPQGTLYGKNTNAGAISVITKKPNLEELEGYVEATAGNFSTKKITLSASAPLSDNVAYRVSGNINERDGYYDNAGGEDADNADDWNLIGKLLWETDSVSVLFTASRVERDNTCCGADAVQTSPLVNAELVNQGLPIDESDPFDYDIAYDLASGFEMESDSASLAINYETDFGSFDSITAWNDYEYVIDVDVDRTQLSSLFIQNDVNAGDSLSQEFRFSASVGEQLDYQLGLFYYEQTTGRGDGSPFVFLGDDILTVATSPTFNFLARPGDFIRADHDLETETLAVFGRATWHIGDYWHVTGGLRWTDEDKDADLFSEVVSTAPLAQDPLPPSVVPLLPLLAAQGITPPISLLANFSTPIDQEFSRNSKNTNWLLSISRDIGADTMVFASASTGTKSGGFNTLGGPGDARQFVDEDTTSFELGIKSTLLDGAMRLNATAFYTEIEDFQSLQQLPAGAGSFVSNQGEVEVSGLDINLEALPLPNLTITAGLQYLQDYELTAGPDEGLQLPNTAELSGNLAATLVFPVMEGMLYMRADYSYMDDHATSPASADALRPHDFQDRDLLNLKIGWRNDNWNVSVWSKNLTDDEYASTTLATNPVNGMDAYHLAPPRTYGATLRYDF